MKQFSQHDLYHVKCPKKGGITLRVMECLSCPDYPTCGAVEQKF